MNLFGRDLISVKVERSEKSARGLAHSKTLSRVRERKVFRQVLECGSPLPLLEKGVILEEIFGNQGTAYVSVNLIPISIHA
jgi:hypothetical protein